MKRLALVLGLLYGSIHCGTASADANKAMNYYLNQEYKEAFNLFQQTAHLGHGKSQFNLGVQYLRGQGVKADPVLAYAYLSTAIDNKFMMAGQALKSVAKRLSPVQLESAKAKAQEFIALYGFKGSENIDTALVHNRSFNPAPSRIVNPDVEYPKSFARDGIPGAATYTFDIDKNGVPRDFILLSSYPEPEFAENVKAKLEKSRYTPSKINGSLRVFTNAYFTGLFKRSQLPQETLTKLERKKKRLTSKARSGDVNAQSELASLLVIMNTLPDHIVTFDKSEVQAAKKVPVNVILSASDQPDFAYNPTLEENFFNFDYLVWLNEAGEISKKQAFNHLNIPQALLDNANETLSKWQLKFSEPDKAQQVQGPYLVSFYYNNEAEHSEYANHLARTNVKIKSIMNQSKYKNPDYWRKLAAKGGHAESLFQLGANCNLRLLTVAANIGYEPAEIQAAKCIYRLNNPTKEEVAQAKSWLVSAHEKGNLIAKRELAGLYAINSNNKAELELAITLAQHVADESDDPLAYEYLAAAYAKLGDFDEAIDYQEQAIKEASDKDYYMKPFNSHLVSYQNNKLATW